MRITLQSIRERQWKQFRGQQLSFFEHKKTAPDVPNNQKTNVVVEQFVKKQSQPSTNQIHFWKNAQNEQTNSPQKTQGSHSSFFQQEKGQLQSNVALTDASQVNRGQRSSDSLTGSFKYNNVANELNVQPQSSERTFDSNRPQQKDKESHQINASKITFANPC